MQKIHLKAPDMWINDPNGFIYYKGKYHLFYQCFLYEPRWGRMHWGHAVSEDLVHWEHQKIALFPSKKADRDGCFSGSAVEHGGKLYLYYTGVRYLEEDPEDTNLYANGQFESSQMMLVTEDGIHFDNIKNKKTVIPVIEDERVGDRRHTRDPKVWRGKDAWYMMLGSTWQDEKGRLLFYRSKNLEQWEHVNTVEDTGGFGWMWECPDYFETEGGQALIYSPIELESYRGKTADYTICREVAFDETTCRMEFAPEYQFLDYGLDLYAPQSTTDENGRRVLVAWARMPKAVEGRWSGMFCIPRLVELADHHFYFRVHPNIKKMFRKKIASPGEAAEGGYKVECSLEDGERVDIGGYLIYRRGNVIGTDRSRVFVDGENQECEFYTPELKGGFRIEAYVDEHLIEVYVNDGEYVITNTVYGLGKEMQAGEGMQVDIYTLG